MNWIQNVSYEEIKAGKHFDCGSRAVLIQIMDPGMSFPWPKHTFAEKHQFNFFDDERENNPEDITENQAAAIVTILRRALEEERNVIVHCAAGLCRSGAVAEVGIMMGFIDTEKFRLPNTLVKRRMMKALGLTYDSEVEKLDMTDSGIIIGMMRSEYSR